MQQQAHGGNLAWAAVLAGCPPDAIVDFSASISPLGPPQSTIAAITSQLGNLRHYPDPDYSDLRAALGHFHQLPPEWILPGNGSAELLTLVGRDLSQLAATILLTPAFGDYYRTLAAYEAKVLEFPLLEGRRQEAGGEAAPVLAVPVDGGLPNPEGRREEGLFNQQMNLSDLDSYFCQVAPASFSGVSSGDLTGLLGTREFLLDGQLGLLINNPHNPTGQLFFQDSIRRYLEKLALVVVDEAFMDFLPPSEEQSLIPLVQEYENLVILRSLTKFYSLPGLRLGYAIAHPQRLSKWQQWRDPWPVNTLAAAAAVAAIKDQEFQQLSWEWLPPARDQLFQGLAALPGLKPQPSAANFLLVESQISTTGLQQKLLQQHKILIRDCLSFKELGDRYFRVAVRSPAENQRLIEALHSVLTV